MKMKNPYMVKVLYKVKIYKITVLMLPRKKKKKQNSLSSYLDLCISLP